MSAIGAFCSLTYCLIGLVLGCIYANNGLGSVGGRDGNSPTDKALSERGRTAALSTLSCMHFCRAAAPYLPASYRPAAPATLTALLLLPPLPTCAGMMSALGSIAFAYTFSLVLLEIQDTLRQPPNAVKTMKKAINISVTAAAGFYLTVGCTGYAALGSNTPGELLNGFPDAPNWVIVVANLAVCVHMISAIQLFAQPIFHTCENVLLVSAGSRWPPPALLCCLAAVRSAACCVSPLRGLSAACDAAAPCLTPPTTPLSPLSSHAPPCPSPHRPARPRRPSS